MKTPFLTLLLLIAACGLRAAPIVVGLAGDSTVCDYPATVDQAGWGQYLGDHFDSGVVVANLAKGGRSTKTFLNEGLWKSLLARHPDVILIQFGHNDSHSPDHPEHTDPSGEYATILRQFVDQARAQGALPILVTPVQRRTKEDSLLPYVAAMKAVAREKQVGVIDLHQTSGELYARLGPQGTAALEKAGQDHTHFNRAGAAQITDLVVPDLLAQVPALKAHLKPKTP
jgi:lysophospholipase L1-like esterase